MSLYPAHYYDKEGRLDPVAKAAHDAVYRHLRIDVQYNGGRITSSRIVSDPSTDIERRVKLAISIGMAAQDGVQRPKPVEVSSVIHKPTETTNKTEAKPTMLGPTFAANI